MVIKRYSRVRCFSLAQSFTHNNDAFLSLPQALANARESTHTANAALECTRLEKELTPFKKIAKIEVYELCAQVEGELCSGNTENS